jgi:hypothetical protein
LLPLWSSMTERSSRSYPRRATAGDSVVEGPGDDRYGWTVMASDDARSRPHTPEG